MRGAFFLLILTAALLWGGGQGLYTTLTNPEPTVLSCAEYAKQKPDVIWLRLESCEYNLIEAAFKGSGKATKLFIPLRAPNAAETDPVHIMLVSKDPTFIDLTNQMIEVDKAADESKVLSFIAAHPQIMGERSFEGLVEFGINLKSEEKEQVQKLQENIAEDFILLEEGEKPRLGLSLGLFIAGLALLSFGLFRILRSRSNKTA